jgi:hypothetical protein
VDKRKLGMSQGEVIRGRHLIVRFRFWKKMVVFGGKIQKNVMCKLWKNKRPMKKLTDHEQKDLQRMRMCLHRSTHLSSIHQ